MCITIYIRYFRSVFAIETGVFSISKSFRGLYYINSRCIPPGSGDFVRFVATIPALICEDSSFYNCCVSVTIPLTLIVVVVTSKPTLRSD